MSQLADFGLALQPMLHVDELGTAIGCFEEIGGELVFGSRDGDWALMRFGQTHLSLLAHPPGPDASGPVELQFTATAPLEQIEHHLASVAPDMIERGVGDEAFGRMLKLRTPNGEIIKVLELERDLIV